MRKMHIMIVEKQENEIEFFKDALEESGLDFFCTVARSIDQCLKMLNGEIPDVVFVNVNEIEQAGLLNLKQVKFMYSVPIILYTTINTAKLQSEFTNLIYVQLPKSISMMARILKNLFINNTSMQLSD